MKTVMILWVLIALLFLAGVRLAANAVETIGEVGLKSIIECVWEGGEKCETDLDSDG